MNMCRHAIQRGSVTHRGALTALPLPPGPNPRSLKTFGRMRDEMVYAALRCKRPKWLVFWYLMRGKRFKEEELFYAPDEVGLGCSDEQLNSVPEPAALCAGRQLRLKV